MKYNLVATTLAAVMAISAPTLAFAKSHHHRNHATVPDDYRYSNDYGYSGDYRYANNRRYPISPYGYGTPSYSSPYGTYPSYTYDPDPNLRAQLRSDFNRGVDFPGNGR